MTSTTTSESSPTADAQCPEGPLRDVEPGSTGGRAVGVVDSVGCGGLRPLRGRGAQRPAREGRFCAGGDVLKVPFRTLNVLKGTFEAWPMSQKRPSPPCGP